MQSKKGRTWEKSGEQSTKEAMRFHSEKQTCPRRGLQTTLEMVLRCGQPQRGSKAFWDTEQVDRHLARSWGTRVAKQPLLNVEAIMCALCTRQRRVREIRGGRETRILLHLHVLATQQLSARPSMVPTAPITPEHRCGADEEGMQEHAHLARLGSSATLPLALFAQGTRATTANAGGIDHAQAPIGFSASLIDRERLARWTAQRAIGLQGKVLSREATRFPGQSHDRRSIPLCRRCRKGLFLYRRQSRSKRSGTDRIGSQLMAQFQAQVPHPLKSRPLTYSSRFTPRWLRWHIYS